MAWVYILECADGLYYVGSARTLESRVEQHMAGGGTRFTRRRLPVSLVFAQEFDNIGEAYECERRLHGWSRAKKRALIDGEFNELHRLASRRFRVRNAGADPRG